MKRREFLSHVLLGGAMAGLATRAVAIPTFFASSQGLGTERRKVVFISDIHLSADASTSWISENIGPLADFLEAMNGRHDVAELVILGDLFDDWMVPTDDPPGTFKQILEADHNEPVVSALKGICGNPFIQVTYVTGNHDLLSFVQATKDLIQATFPRMVICSEEPGLGAYSIDDVLWAEHGHRYSLFNAPDTWSHDGSHLPLGYFITRLVASQSAAEGAIHNSPDIIEQFVQPRLRGLTPLADNQDRLIAAVFNAIAVWAGKGPLDRFTMDGKDGFNANPTVANITRLYSSIMSAWPDRQNIVAPDMALLNELGYLINSAQLLFSMPKRIQEYFPFKPRIVVFGHSHKPLLWQRLGRASTLYANTGTWIDGKPMTWVEADIQERSSNRSYTLTLWYLGQTSPSQSGTIVVAKN